MVLKDLFARLGFEVDESGFQKAQSLLSGVNVGLAAIAGAAAAAAGAIFYAIGATAQQGAEVSRTAQKVGLTTDALQELRYAATASGVSAETLDNGLIRFSRHLDEIGQGSADKEQALARLADQFAAMPDGTKKTALALENFSRSGAELIPLLNKGRAGIAALKEEALKFGVVLDKDTIERSKELVKSNRQLDASLTGLRYALVGPLIQANKVKIAITQWIVENRKFIAQGFHKTLHVLAIVGGGVVNALKMIVTNTPLLVAALVAIGFAFRASIVEALAAAAAWVVAALPWIGLGAAIFFVIGLLDDFYVTLQGGDSIMNKYGANILKWIEDFTTPKEGEWWITTRIKDAIYALTHLYDIVREVSSYFANPFGTDSHFPTSAEEARARFGNVSSSVGVAPTLPAGAGVTSPMFNNQITINTGPGAKPEDIGNAVVQAIQENMDRHLREAMIGANGG